MRISVLSDEYIQFLNYRYNCNQYFLAITTIKLLLFCNLSIAFTKINPYRILIEILKILSGFSYTAIHVP